MVDTKSSKPPARPGHHYYTPAARIVLVDGVEHKQLPSEPGAFISYADLYIGEAEALERSGLLRPDMLPPPPSYSITWRPDVTRENGESWHRVPGFMEVHKRPNGSYCVKLTVSRREQEAREAACQQEFEARKGSGLIRTTEVLPVQPEVPTRKGHLSLVWSTPGDLK